jgi:hypothetical protein
MGSRITEFVDTAVEAAAGAAYEEAEEIMTESKKIAPYESGALVASGTVDDPVHEGNEITIAFGYGGPSAAQTSVPKKGIRAGDPVFVGYAFQQHEHYPNKVKEGTQWKYLQTPFLAAIPGMADRLKTRILERAKF